jgi:predicted permease
MYSTLLHPTPYPHADRIVQFHILGKSEVEYTPYIYRAQIRQFREAPFIDDVVAMDEKFLAETTTDLPQDIDAVYLSGNAFSFFGVPAMLGRTFLPSDAPEDQAPQPVVVLTYQYWQRRFNGNPAIVGQSMRIDNRSYAILGVMPRNFTWWDADVYLPLDTSDATVDTFMTAIRLKPGISQRQATAEIQPIFQQMLREHPNSILKGLNLELVGINERFKRSLGRMLYVLFTGVLLLLVIGCANVSILLLARGSARRHEFAVRAAVGASAQRIIRQLLTESLILGFSGAVLGVVITYRITPYVVAMLPWQLFPRGLNIPVHIPVLAFSIVVAILTSSLFGLFPALQVAKPEIREIMQANSRKAAGSVSGRKSHAVLIAGQIALAMVLLTAAATAIQSFRLLLRTDLGYDPNHVTDFAIPVHPGSYTTWEDRANYFRQLRDSVAQTPGVVSASLGLLGPPFSSWDLSVEVLGHDALASQIANINFVDAPFFHTLHIPLVEGRLWDEAETSRGARLAVVNQAFVKQYFPNGDVLGHSVRAPRLVNHPPRGLAVEGSDGWASIIGVVGDVRNNGLDSPVKPEIYFPYSLYMVSVIHVFVRAQVNPIALERTAREQIARINPGQQVSYPVRSMSDLIEQQSEWARSHLIAVLSSVFSVLALILASVGLYSVVSYSVAQRINEFGIRMALGAQRWHILKNVLAAVGASVGSGLVIGLLLSFGVHTLLSHWVENAVSDPLMVIGVCLLLIVVSLLACIVPALRASMINPMKALRLE